MRFALALLGCALALPTYAQVVLDAIHNATSLQGTWSSGARNVITGLGFANPANESFIVPATAGISYSFTNDGKYEIARYRFSSNGSQPTCITGTLIWVHGNYQLLSNGSIVMTPLGDGYQLVQDPCMAQSSITQNFNFTETYQQWRIFQDPTNGYKLHLFEADGTPLAPQFQVSSTPNMLPFQVLRNATPGFTNVNGYVSPSRHRLARRANDARSRWSGAEGASILIALGALSGSVLLAL